MTIHKYNPNAHEDAIASRFESAVKEPVRERPSRYARGYGKDWPRLRRAFLREHPACACCGRPAELVDHKQPIAYGGAVYDTDNLQSLCVECHAAKTAADERKYDGVDKVF